MLPDDSFDDFGLGAAAGSDLPIGRRVVLYAEILPAARRGK